jgi:hypothetical protein
VALCWFLWAIQTRPETVSLMILLMVAAWIGGSVTFAVLWPYGALMALLSAPFGGSLAALFAGLWPAILRTTAERKRERRLASFPTEQTEAA